MKKLNTAKPLLELICDIYMALMLSLFLLYFDKSGYLGITEAKLPLFHLISGGFVLVSLLLLPACRLTGMLKAGELRGIVKDMSLFAKLVLVFLAITLLSSLFSEYAAETWEGISRYEGSRTILIYGLSAVLLSSFAKPKPFLLWLLGGGVLLFSALSILQLFGLNPLGLYPEGLSFHDAGIEYTGAYLGTIGNTDMVAAFLCMAISALWVGVLRLADKRRFLLLIPLFAALFVLLRMQVLAGLLAVFGSALLSLPVVLPVSKKRAKTAAIIIFLLIILALCFLYFVDTDISMLHEAHELLHGNADESFGSGRIYIWKSVLERVPDNLLFGAGPDTMIRSGIEPFSRFDPDRGVQIVSEIDAAHNEYLNILYSQGLLALVAYLAALFTLACLWIKKGREKPQAAILGTAVLAYSIEAFFGISMFLTAPYFWMSLGLLDASLTERKK